MTAAPIDLRTVAGNRYRVEYDPAHTSRKEDVWQLRIPCRNGHIYPHSSELLGVATDNRSVGLRVAKVPGVVVWQEADDGLNLVFPVKLLPKVAAVVKPKRKRQMSPIQRQLAGERLAKHRDRALVQSKLARAGGTKAGPDVSLAV